jgi:hypothetical protein
VIVTNDDDLIAEISIARNFQNDVLAISIAGRLTQSVFRMALMSAYTINTSGEASLSSINAAILLTPFFSEVLRTSATAYTCWFEGYLSTNCTRARRAPERGHLRLADLLNHCRHFGTYGLRFARRPAPLEEPSCEGDLHRLQCLGDGAVSLGLRRPFLKGLGVDAGHRPLGCIG